MHIADEPAPGHGVSEQASASRNQTSAALLAAVACVPIVVAVGFLVDRPPPASVPSDISVLALRGGIDAAVDQRSSRLMRAGY